MTAADQQWDVLLPVKPTDQVKSRLLPADPDTRSELVPALFNDTLAALAASDRVARIAIVGRRWKPPSRIAGRIVWLEEPSVEASAQAGLDQLNAALRYSLDFLAVTARRPVMIVAADLPALRVRDLSRILERADGLGESTAFIRDANGFGTTILLIPTGVPAQPCFGADSAKRHECAGAIDISSVAGPGARRDVDTASDLQRALGLGVGSLTALAVAGTGNRAGHGVELPSHND